MEDILDEEKLPDITSQAIATSESTTNLKEEPSNNSMLRTLQYIANMNVDAKIPENVCKTKPVLDNIPDTGKDNVPDNEAEEAGENSLLKAQMEVKN